MDAPDEALNGAEAIASALAIIERISGRGARRISGWATVELDRAERDVAARFASLGQTRARDVPDDALLGARCRLVTFQPAERELLLLEPATEGRIAASLARFGEGPVVVYVLAPPSSLRNVLRDLRDAGLVLSGEGAGPFGRQRLVAGSPPWGAHLCVAQSAGAATIEP